MPDLLIKNGLVFTELAVLINTNIRAYIGKIIYIGNEESASLQSIDTSRLVVSPVSIYSHPHTDLVTLITPILWKNLSGCYNHDSWSVWNFCYAGS